MAVDQDLAQAPLDRWRALVLADSALQDELQAIDEMDSFIALSVARAAVHGIHLGEDQLKDALRPDPLGLSRWSVGAPPSAAVPQRGWLPVGIVPAQGEYAVDWAYFGARALNEPFYENSIQSVMRQPLNRLARPRTRLADLARCGAQHGALRPSGFIFHMSRCGSTLVSQMLASDPRNIVISEASPLDTVVRIDLGAGDAHGRLLQDMVAALGQRRTSAHSRYFIKLDSWHTLALPLFRRAFPDVPWVFLYREPSEVLASQVIQRGIQTVPEYLPPSLFGLNEEDALDPTDYCALVLGRTCEAAIEHCDLGGGLLVNYRDLPQALWTSILPHFGVACSAQEREAMTGAAKFDAKSPSMYFSQYNESKRQIMTDALRATAERRLGKVYRQLESARA